MVATQCTDVYPCIADEVFTATNKSEAAHLDMAFQIDKIDKILMKKTLVQNTATQILTCDIRMILQPIQSVHAHRVL